MSTKYILELENQSKRYGSFCIYQTNPGSKHTDNIYSLAWITMPSHPTTKHQITWSIDYSFEWSQTGFLKPGIRFLSSQSRSADLYNADTNIIDFCKIKGAYTFSSPQELISSPGSLKIHCENSVIHYDESSVGIGIDGKPAFAVNASPNVTFTFIPNVEYWIAFGNYEQGEVIDVNDTTSCFKINFPKIQPMKKIILTENNTFSEVN